VARLYACAKGGSKALELRYSFLKRRGHEDGRKLGESASGEVHQEAHSPGPIGKGQPCGGAHPASIVAGTREPLTPDGGSLEGGVRPAFSAIVSIPNFHPSTDAKHHPLLLLRTPYLHDVGE
jgi:hypothetical protein